MSVPPLCGDPQQDTAALLQATVAVLASRGLRSGSSSGSSKAAASADASRRGRTSASAVLHARPKPLPEPPALFDEAVMAFFDAPADQVEWLENCGGDDLACEKTFETQPTPWRFAGGEGAVMPVAQVVMDQEGKIHGVNDAALQLARVHRRSVEELSFGAYWVSTDVTKEAMRCVLALPATPRVLPLLLTQPH